MSHPTVKLQNNMIINLKFIAKEHRQRLIMTFILVALENILFLVYPLFGSFMVNAIIKGNTLQALSYSVLVLVIWGIGASRRAVDTRAFARIYAEIAVPIILNQRQKGSSHSTITARITLSRQFVDFFEQHLPMMIMSGFSIVGTAVMLLFIEFWVGVMACAILLMFLILLPNYASTNDRLYLKLNNRLEKEVDLIGHATERTLSQHYDILAKLRIRLSNREALGYLWIGVAMSGLFGLAVVLLANTENIQAGHIYAVITYLWTFAISLDDAPRLLEEFSNLKDVSERVQVG
ncbi:ABC transporter six-transmembrane domain-containing protein [Psychrobacter alimentarius]|uniref:ABC transporter six-transmembrane domain-containing protein n=1 Tax=Psychrobacter alimentarius TaxID=261164 RepID=UPI003FD6858A